MLKRIINLPLSNSSSFGEGGIDTPWRDSPSRRRLEAISPTRLRSRSPSYEPFNRAFSTRH